MPLVPLVTWGWGLGWAAMYRVLKLQVCVSGIGHALLGELFRIAC